ncbi:MAG TPA: HAD hydrolase-like protein, partial [Mucilaginibacter sp.]
MEIISGLTPPSPRERASGEREAKVLSFEEDLGEATMFAAIFDMDGTLIDNTPYHFKSWQVLFKKYGKGDLT